MKIAMFGHKRVPSREGGVEIVVGELSTRMAALGHEVTCYNRGKRKNAVRQREYKNVRVRTVWTLDKKGLAALTSSFCAAVCAAFSDAEIVHIHAEGPAFMCWIPKLFGKKVIVTVHGLDWQREKWKNSFGAKYIHAGEKMAVRFADRIIVLSRNMQNYFKTTYGVDTVWIPNGAPTPRPAVANRITDEYGLRKDEYILFLGRLVPEKGVHYLIDAFRRLKTDKTLVIAGGASDSAAYEQRLRKMAEGNERILFLGFVEKDILQELFSNAYVYLLPSDVEGMPLSLLEAMSYGNCCLVSDIPECAEVVEDHGLTFQRGNADDLLRRLQWLCDDPAAVSHYKEISGSYICEKYSWDKVTQMTLELYR